jgi:hypothetical protein
MFSRYVVGRMVADWETRDLASVLWRGLVSSRE